LIFRADTAPKQCIKRYRAHGCQEKDFTIIEISVGRKEMFSKLPASAQLQSSKVFFDRHKGLSGSFPENNPFLDEL